MHSSLLLVVALVAIVSVVDFQQVHAACPDITAYRTDRARKLDTQKLAGLWYELAYKVCLLFERGWMKARGLCAPR